MSDDNAAGSAQITLASVSKSFDTRGGGRLALDAKLVRS